MYRIINTCKLLQIIESAEVNKKKKNNSQIYKGQIISPV